MATVREALSIGKSVPGDVGIEIEVVGRYLPGGNTVYPTWRKESDDSLRGPETAEYVLYTPVMINEVKNVLSILDGAFKKTKTRFTDNTTAGTHVHINVQSLTPKQLITFVCCYFLVEELMVDWCHPSRVGNHFCLRAIDAEWLIDQISEAVETGNLHLLNTDDIRYSSINLLSLFNYGSVEFRALEGCPDFDKLELWCRMLYRIKEGSKKFADPKDIFNVIRSDGVESFLSSLLGQYASEIKKEGWGRKVRRSMFFVKDIAYARNWDEVNYNIFDKKKSVFSS
jgi:hypothetical protein